MKTLEQKAQAYDKAIQELRAMMPNWEHLSYNSKTFLQDLIHIFPELRNSEDKNIIKEIISIVKSYRENCTTEGNHSFDACLAWLKTHGEQKPVDKPNPKFHEGDWVVQENIGIYKVIEVCESWYEVIDNEDNHYSIGFDKEYMCHLWSIKDATPGDILTNGSNIFMLHFINAGRLMSYCHVNTDDRRFYNDIGKYECFCFIDVVVTPTTKEQRELLFQKMHEAGYTFDFETKELQKINGEKVSTTWTEDDEEFLNRAIKAIEHKYPITANWLKTFKQRYTWKPSEEQIKILNEILNFAANHENPYWNDYIFGTLNNLIRQLKKLKA